MITQPKENDMKDLDMGDVIADAQRMKDDYLASFYDMDPLTLQRKRYAWGPLARQGDDDAIDVIGTIGYIQSQVGQLEMMPSEADDYWMHAQHDRELEVEAERI